MHGIIAADRLMPCRSFRIARVWMPVNFIFVGMIWSSFSALKNLGVPMATVLKNVTNLFTIVGDNLLYGKVCQCSVPTSELALSGQDSQPLRAQLKANQSLLYDALNEDSSKVCCYLACAYSCSARPLGDGCMCCVSNQMFQYL